MLPPIPQVPVLGWARQRLALTALFPKFAGPRPLLLPRILNPVPGVFGVNELANWPREVRYSLGLGPPGAPRTRGTGRQRLLR